MQISMCLLLSNIINATVLLQTLFCYVSVGQMGINTANTVSCKQVIYDILGKFMSFAAFFLRRGEKNIRAVRVATV